MPNQLTDSHIDELEERGYVIVHNFLDEEQRKEIAAAVRRILKPWNEIEEAPPKAVGTTASSRFPNRYSTSAALHGRRSQQRLPGVHQRPPGKGPRAVSFPPAGHRYYTAQTLAALEQQYPGWNARNEYRPFTP